MDSSGPNPLGTAKSTTSTSSAVRNSSATDAHISSPGLGQVRLVGLLGEGGMAQVYLGHHDGLGRQVAVKRLRRQYANLDEARERLRSEAEIARGLRHANIVDFLDLVTDPGGDTYLVMEHLAGEPLSARIARVGALPMSETFVIGLQVSDALEAVHRRHILHRDLKTENVLVGLDAAGELLAKLIDFGVAEILGGPGDAFDCPTVVGTPESMSPEQAQAGSIDQRSDIYSFGVLLYEMVAGGPPFQGSDLPTLLHRLVHEEPLPPSQMPGAQRQLIPAALEQLILECLAKNPDDRPQTIVEVRTRLAKIAVEYDDLSVAVELAISAADLALSDAADESTRMVKQALLVVDETTEITGPLPLPVRAVGTSENTHALAPLPGLVAPRPAAIAPVLWTDELPIDSEPEPAVALVAGRDEIEDELRAVRPRRLRRIAGAVLVMAAVAVGIAGLSGALGDSRHSADEMTSPWRR
jgi:tRNA A-37 threonylcarbamoyl transferase component Bud32